MLTSSDSKAKASEIASVSMLEQLRQQLAEAQAQIAELQAALAKSEAERGALQAEVEGLKAENERLKHELNQLKQAPFKSRSRKKPEEQETKQKKAGRTKGHQGSGRKRPESIDHTVKIEVGDSCPDCGTAFEGKVVERERTVEDIEPVRPTMVTRYVIERRWCTCCQAFKEAPVTAALPRHRLGLHVMLFVVYQKTALGLSYGKIRHELRTYFGLTVSRGELSNIVATIARLFGPAYARLIRLMREQQVIHVDETGWRIDGHNHWLWVFVNEMVALYLISRSRGSKVPRALLGEDFEGVVVSDFYSAYSPLDFEKAKCWAHLLNDTHKLASTGKPPPDSEAVQFHRQLHTLYLDMVLALSEAEADADQRQDIYLEMRQKLLAFAQHPWAQPDCQRLAKRIVTYLEDLLVWLRRPDVPADNNAAERALRPAVITRKTSFGSRSKFGAHAFARLISLIQTWERQGDDFFSSAHSLLQSHILSQN